jgi:hypothetical protein
VEILLPEAVYRGVTRDVSVTGLSMRVATRLSFGQHLRLRLHLPTHTDPVEIDVEVRWVEEAAPWEVVGVRFLGLRARDVWAITRYLRTPPVAAVESAAPRLPPPPTPATVPPVAPPVAPPTPADLSCSFCSRTGTQVSKLFSGPQGLICDGCVRTFHFAFTTGDPAAVGATSAEPPNCGLCLQRPGASQRLKGGPRIYICHQCVDDCHDFLVAEASAAKPPT